MKPTRHAAARFGRAVLASGIVLGAVAMAGPAIATDAVDPDADRVLRSMTAFLGGLPAFSAQADVDQEVIDITGQKFQLSSSASVLAQRPDKLYLTRHGAFVDVELIFDGKVVTINGKKLNIYAQFPSAGTIDDAINTTRFETGLDVSAADLFYADAYPGLMTDVTSGRHLGMAWVNGVESHHLAFRGPKVDWQIWIQAGDAPLPMKYVITSKWVASAPQYSVRFRDWDTKPRLDAARFSFTAPQGARKLDEIPVNEMGEIALEGTK